MSVTVTQCINAAALRAYDPLRKRLNDSLWLQILNDTQLDVCTETRCLESEQTCGVTANESRIAYPADCVVIKDVWYTETPADTTTYKPLTEKFRDEWKAGRWGGRNYSSPESYYARPGFVELIPGPATTIAPVSNYGPLWFTYARRCAAVTVEALAVIEIPDWMEGILEDGMVARAKVALREPDGWDQFNQWFASLASKRASVEDRSDDRRPALRTPGMQNPFQGMA